MGGFESLAIALSQPRFRNWKSLRLQTMEAYPLFPHHQLWLFDELVQRFQSRLQESGMIRNINFTAKLVPDCRVLKIMQKFN